MSEKSEKIYEAVTNVSDELVEAAGGRKRPRRAWYIGAVAALLVVAIAVALIRPGAGGSALAIARRCMRTTSGCRTGSQRRMPALRR